MPIIENETETEYRAHPAVSFHKLKAFERSPLLYKQLYITKEIPPDNDTPAKAFGRAAHTLILEGEAKYLRDHTIFGEKVDGRTKDGKALLEWARAEGKPVLTAEDDRELRKLLTSVKSNPDAAELLARGRAEVAIRVGNRQGRLDWLGGHCRTVVDLKTCESLDQFVASVERMGYYRQLAFYQSLVVAAMGCPGPECYLIAVEKSAPYRTGVYKLSSDYLWAGAQQNNASLIRLDKCYSENRWPSGVEGVTTLEPRPGVIEALAAAV